MFHDVNKNIHLLIKILKYIDGREESILSRIRLILFLDRKDCTDLHSVE